VGFEQRPLVAFVQQTRRFPDAVVGQRADHGKQPHQVWHGFE
jgi:hypothetical protein